jgi:hypothetical protein
MGSSRNARHAWWYAGISRLQENLPARATTLASMAFRTLMAVTAKFDLETTQMDAVNAFVHCDLDEVVYMMMPPHEDSTKGRETRSFA